MDHLTACVFYTVVDTGTDTGKDCNTESRSLSSGYCLYITAEHISHHLTLNTVLCSTAAGHHFGNIDPHLADDIVTVCQGVADTLHNGTGHICSGMHAGKTEEYTTAVGVQMRSTLSVEVWKIDQAVCADRSF